MANIFKTVLAIVVLSGSAKATCPPETAYYNPATMQCVSCNVVCRQSRQACLKYNDCQALWATTPGPTVPVTQKSSEGRNDTNTTSTNEPTGITTDTTDGINWRLIAIIAIIFGVVFTIVIAILIALVLFVIRRHRKGKQGTKCTEEEEEEINLESRDT